jgi:hypothetical protein
MNEVVLYASFTVHYVIVYRISHQLLHKEFVQSPRKHNHSLKINNFSTGVRNLHFLLESLWLHLELSMLLLKIVSLVDKHNTNDP